MADDPESMAERVPIRNARPGEWRRPSNIFVGRSCWSDPE